MKRTDYINWDEYFMGIALLTAMRSKDPSSQVGACIVSPENKILSLGYNGMPIGCDDDAMPWEREGDPLDTKYMYVCHAELNAILNSAHNNLKGARVYVTLFPCNECAKAIIQSGISEYNISCNLKAAYESESKEVVKAFEKSILLHVIDEAWKENLRELDELKHSVQNASYEQKDPLLIYKLESVTLFDSMVNKINNQTVSILMRGQIPVQEAPDEQAARRVEVRQAAPEQRQDMSKYRENKQDLSDPNQQAAASQDTREQQRREPIRAEKTVGRNDPCPCGSGKKYKNCHGKNV